MKLNFFTAGYEIRLEEGRKWADVCYRCHGFTGLGRTLEMVRSGIF